MSSVNLSPSTIAHSPVEKSSKRKREDEADLTEQPGKASKVWNRAASQLADLVATSSAYAGPPTLTPTQVQFEGGGFSRPISPSASSKTSPIQEAGLFGPSSSGEMVEEEAGSVQTVAKNGETFDVVWMKMIAGVSFTKEDLGKVPDVVQEKWMKDCCKEDLYDLLDRLLTAGVVTHVKYKNYENEEHPLDIAVSKGYVKVAEVLIRHKLYTSLYVGHKPGSLLSKVMKTPGVDMFHLFLKSLSDPQFRSYHHIECASDFLLDAVLEKRTDIISESLSKHNADIDYRSRSALPLVYDKSTQAYTPVIMNQTALMVVAARGDFSMVDFLLQAKADPNVKDLEGRTALLYAMGAERRVYDNNSETSVDSPFIINPKVVERLLKAQAKTNATDLDGRTAIFYAIEAESIESIELLVKSGVDIYKLDNNGHCPYTMAFFHKNPAVLKALTGEEAVVFDI